MFCDLRHKTRHEAKASNSFHFRFTLPFLENFGKIETEIKKRKKNNDLSRL